MRNDYLQKTIRDTRKRMDELDKQRVRMVVNHEKPVIIHAISDAYLREREKLKVYEYCSTH